MLSYLQRLQWALQPPDAQVELGLEEVEAGEALVVFSKLEADLEPFLRVLAEELALFWVVVEEVAVAVVVRLLVPRSPVLCVSEQALAADGTSASSLLYVLESCCLLIALRPVALPCCKCFILNRVAGLSFHANI